MKFLVLAAICALSVAAPTDAHAFGRLFHHHKPKAPAPKPKPPGGGGGPIPGARYPGLPQSCQTLSNRSHGGCQTVGLGLPAGSDFIFQPDLQGALDSVPRDPAIFDGDTVRPGQEKAYAALLSSYLNSRGICAVYEYDNVMYLRSGEQDRSEDIEFIHSRTRRPNIYGLTQCDPSDQLPTTGPKYSCTFDSSNCNPSNDPSLETFNDDLRAMVREVIAEEKAKGSSSIIDFKYNDNYVDGGDVVGYLLKDDGFPFIDAVAKKALARGYCISTDRWKNFAMKKGTLFSNHSLTHAQGAPDPRTDPTVATKPAKLGLLNACKAYQVRKVDESDPGDWYTCTFILDKWEDRCSVN